jgi:Tripartite tricarboxylate transporter TctB family
VQILKGLLVPGVVAVYITLFWRSTSGMSLSGAGVPRFLIICLAVLIVLTAVSEIRTARARPEPKPSVDHHASNLDSAPDATAKGGAHAQLPEDGISHARDLTRPAVVVVFLVAYCAALTRIGVYPATGIFAACLTFFLGCRRPLLIGLVTMIAVLVSFGFVQLFTLPLPAFAGVHL